VKTKTKRKLIWWKTDALHPSHAPTYAPPNAHLGRSLPRRDHPS
jgi:hypothetical protein